MNTPTAIACITGLLGTLIGALIPLRQNWIDWIYTHLHFLFWRP